jgi:acetate kinase
MRVLVLNAGSSSLKADVLDPATGARDASVEIDRIGEQSMLTVDDLPPVHQPVASMTDALQAAMAHLLRAGPIDAVGHRVVHGGARFTAPTRIDDAVETAVEALIPLAPLHNPAALSLIQAARRAFPSVMHVAVFDTAFHATLPARARAYALPRELTQAHDVRRYGFHGTSHGWVAAEVARHLKADIRELRILTVHLGSGCSVCAVEGGRSVEISSGMTPTEGLVMRTRTGDIDPGALIALARAEGLDLDGLDDLVNKRGGLAGLAGGSGDFRDLEERASAGDEAARMAIHVFCHRLRKYLGAYAALMGGVDAIAFTAGIGEHSALVRQRALQRLGFLGAVLDDDANRDARVSPEAPVFAIHDPASRVQLLVVHTDEARAIARDTAALVAGADAVGTPGAIPIAVSARHIHLTRAAVDALFGVGHALTPLKPLSQPGQFASAELLDIVGPKRTIEKVRVLGPERPACQVEISRTDEFFLGLDAPVRMSGDVANSPGVTLRGPAGTLTIPEGVICAARHIHMTPSDAAAYGVKHKDVVEVEVSSGPRKLIFGDVTIRVAEASALEMHIDTDEANAAELSNAAEGALVQVEAVAVLRRRETRYDSDA